MTTTDSSTTRLLEYIKEVLPWAHGHQRKAVTTFVAAIIDQQSGTQAALARTCGNQEAAVKRLSRLIHNARLAPHALAEAVLEQALRQVPRTGKVRLAIDWTIEGTQYLLVVSLVTGGRAVPVYWRASDQRVLKGRMRRSELAVLKRVLTNVRCRRRAPPDPAGVAAAGADATRSGSEHVCLACVGRCPTLLNLSPAGKRQFADTLLVNSGS